MKDFSSEIKALRQRIDEAGTYLHIEEKRALRPQLETEASRPDLWDDADNARRVTGELSAVIDDLDLYDGLTSDVDDAEVMVELGREEGDDSVEEEVAASLEDVARRLDELELRSLFTGEYDEND